MKHSLNTQFLHQLICLAFKTDYNSLSTTFIKKKHNTKAICSIHYSVMTHAEPLSEASSVMHSHLSSHAVSNCTLKRKGSTTMKNQKLQSNISKMTNQFLSNMFEMEKVTDCLSLES